MAQYGGVVSALMKYAMDMGNIDAAILTRPFNGSLMPQPLAVEKGSQVLACAGSNYIACTVLAELNQTRQENTKSLGVVGLPCQVLALRKMQISAHPAKAKKAGLIIGLFCTWALSFKGITDLLKEQTDPAEVQKMDIPPPPADILKIETKTGTSTLPLTRVRECIRSACTVCFDMTAEFADLSVGMVEGIQEWNTLIVRSEAADKLVTKAKEAGIIVTKPLDQARLEHLREASMQKKKRALAEVVKRTGDSNDLLYLQLSDDEIKAIKPGG